MPRRAQSPSSVRKVVLVVAEHYSLPRTSISVVFSKTKCFSTFVGVQWCLHLHFIIFIHKAIRTFGISKKENNAAMPVHLWMLKTCTHVPCYVHWKQIL
jgi:hypothetical protein